MCTHNLKGKLENYIAKKEEGTENDGQQGQNQRAPDLQLTL